MTKDIRENTSHRLGTSDRTAKPISWTSAIRFTPQRGRRIIGTTTEPTMAKTLHVQAGDFREGLVMGVELRLKSVIGGDEVFVGGFGGFGRGDRRVDQDAVAEGDAGMGG